MKNIRKIFILLIFVLFYLPSFSQTGKTFRFNEIDWTITLPYDFTITDAATDSLNFKEGSKMLEDAGGIKPNASDSKTLISAQKKQTANFSVTISKSSASNIHYWDSINDNVIKIFYKAMVKQAPNMSFDTLRTVDSIDGLAFKNFQMHVKVNETITVHNHYLTRLYQGYTISINYYYLDDMTGEEIKRMLKESKFAPTLIRGAK